MADSPPEYDLGLFPQCGICAHTIIRHERTVALYGDDASTSFRGVTRPFPFPQPGYAITPVDGFFLCRSAGCKRCAESPEFVPIHWDCFEIFRNQCSIEWADALCRLWVAAAWRTPWRGASPIPFPTYAAHSPSLKALCDICELPQLHNLPLELLEMIQSYSEHELIWRGALAFDLAARISNTAPSSLLTMKLKDVIFWERGRQPQVMPSTPSPTPSPTPLPLIRITLDSIGVSQIERVSHENYKGECHRSRAYVVEQDQKSSKYEVQFKDGLLRLNASSFLRPPAVWNTPNPPDLQLCRAYETKSLTQYQRFFATETASITGITFFFSGRQLSGVHIHRAGALCALPSLWRFSRRRLKYTSWSYLPIADEDRILVLGVRRRQGLLNILIRMEKAGDVIVGPYIPNPTEDWPLGWDAPITLIHGEPPEGQPVPYFGAYCQSAAGNGLPKRFRIYIPKSCPLGEEAFLSTASLEGIQSVEVFYDESNQQCRGMMLCYKAGGCLTVGQCRIHVDPVRHFSKPSQICFRNDSVQKKRYLVLHTTRVDWSPDSHKHKEKGWHCEALEGTLVFWHTGDGSSFIAIEK